MPEELTLLPCPACGASDVVMRVDTRAYGFCTACGMCGTCAPKVDAEYAIRQWNSIPRALEWTDEPPKVPGWYWWRTSKGQNVNTIQVWSRSGVLGHCFDTEFITTLDRGEWAGPIPTPLEPEAS